MPFRPTDIDSFNNDVGDWTRDTKSQVVDEMNSLGIIHRPGSTSPVPAQRALKTGLRKNAGITNRISFKFPRHLVFVHKGVGRGTTIGQVGSTSRKPKPFLNPVIDRNLDKLTGIVADHHGTLIVNALMIR